ncbi:hypothetical protein N7540_001276 [Penicillium herquei]|nr:hypothetical protein N7540_001276 [Penicillium herquei]
MVYHLAVMYPNEEGIQFNESYYLQTHMPLVDSKWKKYGLLGWKVIKYTHSMDGSPSKYLIACKLEFENEEGWKVASEDPENAEVFGDIPNFTNVQPITLAGSQI